MKKLTSFLSLLLALTLLLCSCGAKGLPDDLSCKEITDKIVAAGSNVPPAQNYYVTSENNLDSMFFSITITGMFEESPDFDKIDDYAMYICDGNHTYEVDVLRAKTEEDAQVLCEDLKARMTLLGGGDKAMYDPDFDNMMSNAKVFCEGKFAVLLITEDNDAAQEIINSFKK